MSKKRAVKGIKQADPHTMRPAVMARSEPQGGIARRTGEFLLGTVVGNLVGRAARFYAAFFLGIGGLLLAIAWQSGPQQLLQARHFAKLTATAEARIVESWLALDVALADMKDNIRWRAFTKASPCMVVEYEHGDWGTALRRAFCGNRFGFTESYALHDLREIAPKVPFAWQRDAAGFAQPELRLSRKALDWLAQAPPTETVLMGPPPKTALELLQRELDRPLDHALAGWAGPAQRITLALDPADPTDAMPAGFVADRRNAGGNWITFLMFGALGLMFWSGGMRALLGDIGRIALGMATLLPLLGLPWWSESLPRALRAVQSDVGSVFGDMIDTLDPLGRLLSSEPGAAALAQGARLALPAAGGIYAETFGRIRFAPPDTPSRSPAQSADLALAALAETARAQVAAMPPIDRVSLFSRLQMDKTNDLKQAGLVFLPAAREALLDPHADGTVRAAASGFLSSWVTQPVDDPYPNEAGFGYRVKLYRDLMGVPEPVIANPAGWIVERAEKRATAK